MGLSRVPGGPLPIQSRSKPYFLPGSSRPRWAHIALPFWDRGQLPASSCGLVSVPAEEKGNSIDYT